MRAYYDFCAADASESLLTSFPLNKDSVVLDLGGYYGDYTAKIYCRYGCKVFIFEPVKEFYYAIVNRFKNNDSIKMINAGVGSSDKTLRINKSFDGSSVFGKTGNFEDICIVSLTEYIKKEITTQIDLVVINIEGGEYELLDAIFDDQVIAKQIDCILIQFHDFIENAVEMREKIQRQMIKTHDLIWDFPFVWECWKKK